MASQINNLLRLSCILLGLLSSPLGSALHEADKLLAPDQAFAFQASVDDKKNLQLHWQIKPGYYLYKDQVKVIKQNNKTLINTKALPQAEEIHDKNSGTYSVYTKDLLINIPWHKSLSEHYLIVHYQGCNANNLCYEPVNKKIYVSNSHKIQVRDATQAEFDKQSNNEPYTNTFIANINEQLLPMSLLSFFLFGILLSFSPCILPMLPIIISLIINNKQISPRKSLILASNYVLGMACSYSIAGMLADVLGSTLQAWLQQPLILISLAILIVGLALDQFEIINISVPYFNRKLHHWGYKQLQGSIIGAFVLGVIASLIISPCTTPPLIGVLSYIGQDGNSFVGALTLFSLGLGMGGPLVILALLSGFILSKFGTWIKAIKYITGITLLGLTIWLLQRFIPENWVIILWGSLCIVSGVFCKALQKLNNKNFQSISLKIFGLILLSAGIIIIVLGLKKEYRPHNSGQWHNITMVQQLDNYLKTAKERRQPVLIEFYADWCISCKTIEKEVLNDYRVIKNLIPAMLLRVDLTVINAQQHEIMNRFKIYAPPAIVFFDKDGQEIKSKKIVGDLSLDKMLSLTKE